MATPVGDVPATIAGSTDVNLDPAKAAQDRLAAERHDTPAGQQLAVLRTNDTSKVQLVDLTIGDLDGPHQADAKDKILPVELAKLSPQEKLISDLQLLILNRAGNLVVDKLTPADLQKLVDQMQKEHDGDDAVNDGHPHFGPATKKLFQLYKEYLETAGVPGMMQQLLHSDIGIPINSPINLQMVDFNGQKMPEHPTDFYKRMSAGGKQYMLTGADGKPADTDVLPSQDTLNKLLGAEDFLNWGNRELLNGRVNLLEDRLAKRITNEGFPQEWLNVPGRQTDKAGWCRSVQEHIDQCVQMGRAVDAALYLQNKDGMSDLVKEAIAHLPGHIHPTIERDADGKMTGVKEIKFDHAKDLDLANPAFIAQQQANVEWMQKYGNQILQALKSENLAHQDPKHFLYWGDIEMSDRVAVVNGKNEITDVYDKRTGPDRQLASDERSEDINLARCRFDPQEVRDSSGNLKEIVVDFNMQYGEVPPLGYQNLIMNDVGDPQHPASKENPDGKLHFKPDEWVVVRDNHGQDVVMQAKDLADYKATQEFNYYFDKGVTIAMDASMLVTGVGAIGEGMAVRGGANMAMSLLQGSEEGLKAAQLSARALEEAGQKQILTGVRECFLGGSGLLNNAWGHENAGPLLAVRNAAFTYQALRSIPGFSQLASGMEGLVGLGKSADTIATARGLLTEADQATLSPGPLLSFLKSGGETGLKWSGRAFGYTLARELNDQRKEIQNAGNVDGASQAIHDADGLLPVTPQLTLQQKLERQKQFLASTEKVLDDYVRTHDISKDQTEITKILDTTKHLLEPPSPDIAKDKDKLAAFEKTRAQEIEDFKADLRHNLVWSKERIHDAELQHANDPKYNIESNFQELQDRKTLVDDTRHEQDAVDAANAAFKDKQDRAEKAQRDLNDEKNQKDAAKKALLAKASQDAQHELAFAQLQLDTAKARLSAAQDKAHQDLLHLQDEDQPVNGTTAFEGKDDVKAASALAYMLLCVDKQGNLPKDGVLYSKTENVQGFHVTKTYANDQDESGSTHNVEVEQKDHDALVQIRVSDLARYFTPDLQKDQSADKRMSTGETLDRLGVISLDTHASLLKNILNDKNATADDKSKALVDLGSVVSMLEISEAQRKYEQTMSQQVAEAGDHFSNTSSNLKALIASIASDDKQDKNVRGEAALYSYILGPHRTHLTAEDQAILQKAIGDGHSKPGLSYDECISFLQKQAGLDSSDISKAPDADHRDAKVFALIALDKLLPAGNETESDISHFKIAKELAKCVTPDGYQGTLSAIDALLQPAPGFDNRSRLSLLDNGDAESQQLAIQVRKAALDGIELKVKPDKLGGGYDMVDAYAHAGLIQRLPELLDRNNTGSNGALVETLRQRAVQDVSGSLGRATAKNIAQSKAGMLIAQAKTEAMNDPSYKGSKFAAEDANDALAEVQAKWQQATAEFSAVTGRSVKEIPPSGEISDQQKDFYKEISDLQKKIHDETLAGHDTKQLERQLQDKFTGGIKDADVVGGRIDGKPNLSSLSVATRQYQELAQASIDSLAKLGIGGNLFATEVLKEHAQSDPANATYERNSLIRYAAVKALQDHVMSPLDFSTWAAEQVQNEMCPAIADVIRGAARYAEVGMNPVSLAHQSDVAAAGGNNTVTGYVQDFRKQLISDAIGPYHFLSGDDLGRKLADAKGVVYDGHGIRQFFDDDAYLEQNKTTYIREKQALDKKLEEFWNRVQDDLINKATSESTDPSEQTKRRHALQACIALICTTDDNFKGYAANKHPEAFGDHKKWDYASSADIHLDEAYDQLQRKAVEALLAATRPNMPDAEFAAGLIENALSPGLIKDSYLREKLVDGLDDYATHHADKNLHAANRDACEAVCRNLVNSIKNIQDYGSTELQLRSLAYLKEHATVKELPYVINQLESVFKQATPNVQDAIRDFIASKRDDVEQIYNAAPDNTSKDPVVRAALLDRAMHDLEVVNRRRDPLLTVDILAGQQDAAYLIFESVKGLEHADPDDPRISKLKELMKEKSDQFGQNYDNVRFAAAVALFKLSDTGSNNLAQAYKTIAEIAAECPMPGIQRDATGFLRDQTAQNFDQVEAALREVADKERSNLTANKTSDTEYKLANSLHNLGTLLQKSDRKSDAGEALAESFCYYCGIDPPMSTEQLSKMKDSDLDAAISRATTDTSRDPHAFNDCMLSLAEVLAPGLKQEDPQFQFAKRLAEHFSTSGPDQVTNDWSAGSSELFRLARFYLNNGMADQAEFSLNWMEVQMEAMKKPVSDRDQIQFNDLMAQIALKGGLAVVIGEDPAYINSAKGANYAANAYNMKLKDGYSIEELAKSASNFAILEERIAQCPPQDTDHLKTAEKALTTTADYLRKAGDKHLPALTHELHLLSDFYDRRGDKQKSDQYKAEAKEAFDKLQIQDLRRLSLEQLKDLAADSSALFGVTSDTNIACSGAINIELNRRMLRDVGDDQIIAMIEPLKQRSAELAKSDPQGKTDASHQIAYLLGPSLYREFAKEAREHNYDKARETLRSLILQDRKVSPNQISRDIDQWMENAIFTMPGFKDSAKLDDAKAAWSMAIEWQTERLNRAAHSQAANPDQEHKDATKDLASSLLQYADGLADIYNTNGKTDDARNLRATVRAQVKALIPDYQFDAK